MAEVEERAVADTAEEVVEKDEAKAEAKAEIKTVVNASRVATLRTDITSLRSIVT